MNPVKLRINGQEVEATAGTSILQAARMSGIYIPALCSHPDLGSAEGFLAENLIYQCNKKTANARPYSAGKGCGLCLVSIRGESDLVKSCITEVTNGMSVITENDNIREQRRNNLVSLLSIHPHACLTCAQQEGCSLSQCSSSVPEEERCCSKFGHCELQDVANYIGIPLSTPGWLSAGLPVFEDQPLFVKDYNLCIGCTRCVRVCRDIIGIGALGFVYDETGRIQVGTIEPTLEASGCKFCNACVEVCPTGALMDKSACMGKMGEDIVPCREICPVHIDIPGYLRLIAEGRRNEAAAVIRERVPFPGVLGRVCPHPCEKVCRRGDLKEPVSICALKRYAEEGDQGLWKVNSKFGSETGKKVAIVGAGPAGLTAAFYLRKKGHGVTVFDARARAGGMMRYGIARHRLPEEILDREINEIFKLGIEFRKNQSLGNDFTIDQLKNDGYEAIFLAVGAQSGRRITLEKSDLPDVLWGVDFLVQVAEGRDIRLKENVIVIGGGNVAVDSSMTALRCGAKNATIACLEKREDMPAYDWEIERAVKEGVKVMPSLGLSRILHKDGHIEGVELIECTSVLDENGNFSPSFSGKKENIKGDQLILAIGQTSDLSFIGDDSSISVEAGFIVVDKGTLETGLKGVYSGGDVTGVPWSVIDAIADGRKAAASIDKFLGGSGDIEEVLFSRGAPNRHIGRDEGFASWPREKVPELGLESSHQGFQEIVSGYSDQQALKEAKRCLQCDLRLFFDSNPVPPKKIKALNRENINAVPEGEGVFRLYDVEKNVIFIKGCASLKDAVTKALNEYKKAAWFDFEENRMYSMRESEMIQRHIHVFGKMPGFVEDEIDDLF
ncbi:MAG: FAD-dependent oxidoreductase [Deltaproteobacteria bacterium]|nr:FAD-dependent oxidoreductase [Deltaproteobacteria bacterium]